MITKHCNKDTPYVETPEDKEILWIHDESELEEDLDTFGEIYRCLICNKRIHMKW